MHSVILIANSRKRLKAFFCWMKLKHHKYLHLKMAIVLQTKKSEKLKSPDCSIDHIA